MGILFKQTVEGPAELGVWVISEKAEELLQQIRLSPEEQNLYSFYRNENRKKQWLAYRRLIREIISPQEYPVHYDELGKPFLAGSDWHISVTHTGDFAGVIISRHHKVGIDLETIRPRIEKIKDKFLSEEELEQIREDRRIEMYTLAWCAKEALYKLYGNRNLDFRKNMQVNLPDDLQQGHFPGRIIHDNSHSSYKIFFERNDDHYLVWVIDSVEVK